MQILQCTNYISRRFAAMYRKIPPINKIKVRPLTTSGVDSECRAGDDLYNSYHREKLTDFRQAKKGQCEGKRSPAQDSLGSSSVQSPIKQVLDVLQNHPSAFQKKYLHASGSASKYFNNDDPNTVDCNMVFSSRVCYSNARKRKKPDNFQKNNEESQTSSRQLEKDILAYPLLANPDEEFHSLYVKGNGTSCPVLDRMLFNGGSEKTSLEEAFLNVLIESNKRLNAFAELHGGLVSTVYTVKGSNHFSSPSRSPIPSRSNLEEVRDRKRVFEHKSEGPRNVRCCSSKGNRKEIKEMPESVMVVGKRDELKNSVNTLEKIFDGNPYKQKDFEMKKPPSLSQAKKTSIKNQSDKFLEENKEKLVFQNSENGRLDDFTEVTNNAKVEKVTAKGLDNLTMKQIYREKLAVPKIKDTQLAHSKVHRVKAGMHKILASKGESQPAFNSNEDRVISISKDITDNMRTTPKDITMKQRVDRKNESSPFKNVVGGDVNAVKAKRDVKDIGVEVAIKSKDFLPSVKTNIPEAGKTLKDRLFFSVDKAALSNQVKSIANKLPGEEKRPVSPSVRNTQPLGKTAENIEITNVVETKSKPDERNKIFERAANANFKTSSWKVLDETSKKEETKVETIDSKYIKKDRSVEEIFEKHLEKYRRLKQTVTQDQIDLVFPGQSDTIRRMQGRVFARPGLTEKLHAGPTTGMKKQTAVDNLYKRPIVIEKQTDVLKGLQVASSNVWGGLEPTEGRELLNFCCRHNDGDKIPVREENMCCRIPTEASSTPMTSKPPKVLPTTPELNFQLPDPSTDTSWYHSPQFSLAKNECVLNKELNLQVNGKSQFFDAVLEQKEVKQAFHTGHSISGNSSSQYFKPVSNRRVRDLKVEDLLKPFANIYAFNNIENPQGILKYFNNKVASWDHSLLDKRKPNRCNNSWSNKMYDKSSFSHKNYSHISAYQQPTTAISVSRRQICTYRGSRNGTGNPAEYQFISRQNWAMTPTNMKASTSGNSESKITPGVFQNGPKASVTPIYKAKSYGEHQTSIGSPPFHPQNPVPPTPHPPGPVPHQPKTISPPTIQTTNSPSFQPQSSSVSGPFNPQAPSHSTSTPLTFPATPYKPQSLVPPLQPQKFDQTQFQPQAIGSYQPQSVNPNPYQQQTQITYPSRGSLTSPPQSQSVTSAWSTFPAGQPPQQDRYQPDDRHLPRLEHTVGQPLQQDRYRTDERHIPRMEPTVGQPLQQDRYQADLRHPPRLEHTVGQPLQQEQYLQDQKLSPRMEAIAHQHLQQDRYEAAQKTPPRLEPTAAQNVTKITSTNFPFTTPDMYPTEMNQIKSTNQIKYKAVPRKPKTSLSQANSGQFGSDSQDPGSHDPPHRRKPPNIYLTTDNTSSAENPSHAPNQNDQSYNRPQESYENRSVPRMGHEQLPNRKSAQPFSQFEPQSTYNLDPQSLQHTQYQQTQQMGPQFNQQQYQQAYHQWYQRYQQLGSQQHLSNQQTQYQQQPQSSQDTSYSPYLKSYQGQYQPFFNPATQHNPDHNIWAQKKTSAEVPDKEKLKPKKVEEESKQPKKVSIAEEKQDYLKSKLDDKKSEKPEIKKPLLSIDKPPIKDKTEKSKELKGKDKSISELNKPQRKPSNKQARVRIIKTDSKEFKIENTKRSGEIPYISTSIFKEKTKGGSLKDKLTRQPIDSEVPQKPKIVDPKTEKKHPDGKAITTAEKLFKSEKEADAPKRKITVPDGHERTEREPPKRPKSPKVTIVERYPIKSIEKPPTHEEKPLVTDVIDLPKPKEVEDKPERVKEDKVKPDEGTDTVKAIEKEERPEPEKSDETDPKPDLKKEKAPKSPGGILPSNKTLDKIIEKSGKTAAKKSTTHFEKMIEESPSTNEEVKK